MYIKGVNSNGSPVYFTLSYYSHVNVFSYDAFFLCRRSQVIKIGGGNSADITVETAAANKSRYKVPSIGVGYSVFFFSSDVLEFS